MIARARAAETRSARVVTDARTLRAVATAVRCRRLTARCAWCGRFELEGRWIDAWRIPHFASWGRTGLGATHTICPGCVAELRRDGRSV